MASIYRLQTARHLDEDLFYGEGAANLIAQGFWEASAPAEPPLEPSPAQTPSAITSFSIHLGLGFR